MTGVEIAALGQLALSLGNTLFGPSQPKGTGGGSAGVQMIPGMPMAQTQWAPSVANLFKIARQEPENKRMPTGGFAPGGFDPMQLLRLMR